MKALIRIHQILLVLAILSGCYSPEIRDCTVTCAGSDECAGGQVCTKGFCAAEGVSCDNGPGPNPATDAGIDGALPRVMLHVKISGNGKVDVTGAASCGEGGMRDCMIAVFPGAVTATATAFQTDHPFDKWESMTCANAPATCMFVMTSPTTIEAKFK